MKASKITAIDFFEDLTSPYARKRFFWGFVVFAVCCIGVIIVARMCLPYNGFREVLESVSIEILSGSIIILLFYFLYFHFIGENYGLREVVTTRPQDIGGRLSELIPETRYYIFWGRSGSYFRSVPLIKLDEQSRSRKSVIDVEVVLPDPHDERLVESYQDILNSLGEYNNKNSLLSNVIATSMACAIINSNNKFRRLSP